MNDPTGPPSTGPLTAALNALRARRGVLAAIGVIAAVGLLAEAARRLAAPSLRGLPQYRVTASSISLTPPPAWVRTDVKLEALRNAGLLGDTGQDLSILDDPQRLESRVSTAIGFHPWVRRVGTIRREPPNRLLVEVEYRRPLASVRSGRDEPRVIDAQGFLLPGGQMPAGVEAALPRIEARHALADGASPPRVGDRWNDPRIAGAVSLVASLGEAWAALRLVDVTPSRAPEVRHDRPYYVYELRSTGNTRIAWGAAPGFAPTDEPPFAEKLARLQAYVATNGPLDSVASSPAWIDVRRGLTTRPRVVKKDEPTQTAAKPDDERAVK